MAEAKPKLNNLQKHLIIQLLGAYYTINETLDILKEYYELELTYQAIHWYWKIDKWKSLKPEKTLICKLKLYQ